MLAHGLKVKADLAIKMIKLNKPGSVFSDRGINAAREILARGGDQADYLRASAKALGVVVESAGTYGERENPPAGWHEQKSGELVCPHRDTSVCPACIKENPEAWDCYGAHFWVPVSQRPTVESERR